jgi:hypothetical protein
MSPQVDTERQRKARAAKISWELAEEIHRAVVGHYGPNYSVGNDVLIVASLLIRPIPSPFDLAPTVEEIAALTNRPEEQVQRAISNFQDYRPSWIYTDVRLYPHEFQVGYPGLHGQPGSLTNSISYGKEALKNMLNVLPSEHHSIPLVQQWEKLNKDFLLARKTRDFSKRHKDFLQDFRRWYFQEQRPLLRPDKPAMKKPHEVLTLYRLTTDGLKGAQRNIYKICMDNIGAAPTSNKTCKKCDDLFGRRCQSISAIPKT